MAGTRPRHLPQGPLVAAAALPQELPSKCYVHYYLYLAALDAQQIEQAGQHLAAYRVQLPQQPAAMQAGGWLESAFFAAAYQHDLPAARAFQAQARPSVLVTPDVTARVEAALARLADDPVQALALAQTALQALPHSIDPGSTHLYAEWLADTVRWASSRVEQPLHSTAWLGGLPSNPLPLYKLLAGLLWATIRPFLASVVRRCHCTGAATICLFHLSSFFFYPWPSPLPTSPKRTPTAPRPSKT
ncbi:hypothetical protein [Hymenobacter coccineus]|uniref:Uncharacterized protein n=1 Tax=Hymenobacter coccineus TaxID=1908235 RepID=A0A1G1TKH8_9BACT|nr:hypothetical protein [Hymenobacter coccineus]OGX91365.1 hypothetical protein BEN49_05070 [Hymenobacter coccineus]